MAVDYLKTYLGIDPDDYSAMEARIRGEEPQAQAPVMMRQPMMMPQRRSLSDIEAMPSMPRVQIQPQVDDRYQSLMDEIASLKAQIEGLQAPTEQAPVMAEQVATEQAPVMVDEPVEINMEDAKQMFYQSPEFKDYQERTKNMVQNMAFMPKTYTDPVTGKTLRLDDRSGLFQDWYKKTYGRDLSISSPNRSLPSLSDALKRDSFQAPPEIQNRMVGEPVPFVAQEPVPTPTPAPVIPQAPSQDIQSSIDYLAKLPKMNIPQIPDVEEIKRKIVEANLTLPTPISYEEQLQEIRDLPKITQMPTREEIQTAMQNIPTPIGANVTNPFQKINDILPQSTIDQFQAVASKPNPFVPQQMPQQKSSGIFGNLSNLVKKEVQQPQMQSYGRPSLPISRGFMPEMRASGGGIDKAIYDLKFKLNGR